MSTSETEKETQFDAVYRELFGDVYAYFNICFGEQTAEDLAQEAFLRVWRAVDSGKIPDNWRAWVFRCAVNLKNDFLRRKYTESGVQSFETAVLPATAAPDEGETLIRHVHSEENGEWIERFSSGAASVEHRAPVVRGGLEEKRCLKRAAKTGCFLLMNTGSEIVKSKNGLVTTIAVGYEDHVEYALEGSIFVAGAAVQWLRDELGVVSNAAESQEYAEKVPDTAGGYVVPAFTGLGAPYWNQQARGAIVGITRGFSRAHLIRATLESLAYQTYDIARAMERDSGIRIGELKVDGGACANDFLMQFQSDLIGCDVYRPRCIETTALGAAYLAGLAVGYWDSLEDVKNNWAIDRVFTSGMEEERRIKLLDGWHRAVKCALTWAEE